MLSNLSIVLVFVRPTTTFQRLMKEEKENHLGKKSIDHVFSLNKQQEKLFILAS
jgi:hypothetical protein